MCKLILRFSHNAAYMAVQADITHAQAKRLQEAVKQIRPSKKDLRRLGKGNLAGVATGEDILNDMQEQERKNEERAAKRVSGRAWGGRKETAAQAGPQECSTYHLYPYESVLWLLPGAHLLFAFRVVLPTESYDLPITLPLAPTITSPHSLSLRMRSQMTSSHPLKSLRTISPAYTQDLGRNPSPPSKEGCGPTERL